MGVIRVTEFGEEFTFDNCDCNKQPEETSNPITVNSVNNSAESLNIEDVEIINYIENQSDAFIQTGYSSTKEDNTKVVRDIMYFDNKQYRFDGDDLCFGIMKRSDACSMKYKNVTKNTQLDKVKVAYNIFQKITFISNAGTHIIYNKFVTGNKTELKAIAQYPQSEFSIGNISDKVINDGESILYFTDMLLFKNNEEHSNYKARLKTAQIYKNDVLVRDYVAAKCKKDNKVGLFDKVENKFYTSPNGTEFIAG